MHLSRSRILFIVAFIFSLLGSRPLRAQEMKQGEWRSYTSLRTVHDVAANFDSTAVWAATDGGAFRIKLSEPNVASILALRNSDGLVTNELSAVAADKDGFVYLGAKSGAIDIYNEHSGKLRHLLDIALFDQFPRRTINAISIYDDRVYFSTAYGITIYSKTRNSLQETVKKFGTLLEQSAVLGTIESGSDLYVALQDAVAITPKNSLVLGKDSSWILKRPPTGQITSIAEFRGRVFVATTNGLFEAVAGNNQLVQAGAFTGSIVRLAARDSLYLLDPGGTLYSTVDLNSVTSQHLVPGAASNPANALALTKTSQAVGFTSSGVSLAGTIDADSLYPAGPVVSDVGSLNFAQGRRELYSSHAVFGLSSFNVQSGTWITHSKIAAFPDVRWKSILYDSVRNTVWGGAEAKGIIRLDNFESANPIGKNFPGLPPTLLPDFVTAGEGMILQDGRAALTSWSINGQGVQITSDGETFQSPRLSVPGDVRSYARVAQDQEGTIWVATEANGFPPSFGVSFLTSAGVTGGIPGGAGGILPSANINAMLVDQDDGLWLGSEQGVHIVSNLSSVTSGVEKPFFRPVPLVAGQIIHAMATDGVGNKWIGTDNGVFIVSPDGSDSVGHYTHENSPLVDNFITSIAIDITHGEAYLGTPKGISRVSTIFREGKSDYSGISVYPNPVTQTETNHPTIYVRGLVAQSTVKIYTISGRLVASIDGSQLGERVSWNGLDVNGKQLASGVYLISATSPQSTDRGESKIVIIRSSGN